MKKILIKLGAFAILSTIMSINLIAFAEIPPCNDNTAPTIQPQCIQTEKQDKTNIITIIEEPLFGNTLTDKFQDGNFKLKTCFRQTMICTITEGEGEKQITKRVSASELVNNCTQDTTKGTFCNEVMVIISKAGPTMIQGYISMIYSWAAGFVGLIAVAVIIISSIQISLSGGDPQAVTNSKDRILKSLAGLAVLFLSGLILYTINPNFFTI